MTVLLLVAGAVVGSVLSVVLQEWLNSLRLRIPLLGGRHEFSGTFLQKVPAYGSGDRARPERHDLIRSKYRDGRIWGEITRQFPAEEAGQRWLFRGYVHGTLLVAAFWTVTPRRDPTSFGTIVMHRTSPSQWDGRYWRPGTESDARKALNDGSLDAPRLSWNRS